MLNSALFVIRTRIICDHETFCLERLRGFTRVPLKGFGHGSSPRLLQHKYGFEDRMITYHIFRTLTQNIKQPHTCRAISLAYFDVIQS